MINKLFLTTVFFALLFSCKKDEVVAPDNSDQIIKDYLNIKGLNSIAIRDSSSSGEMYVIIERQGTGDLIGSKKNVKVFYKGYYPENDSVYFVSQGGNPDDFEESVYFDQSGGDPASFQLASVIKGWQIGIPYFREGAEGTIMEGAVGKIIVPSKLGYGDGKVRIFDIKIQKFY